MKIALIGATRMALWQSCARNCFDAKSSEPHIGTKQPLKELLDKLPAVQSARFLKTLVGDPRFQSDGYRQLAAGRGSLPLSWHQMSSYSR